MGVRSRVRTRRVRLHTPGPDCRRAATRGITRSSAVRRPTRRRDRSGDTGPSGASLASPTISGARPVAGSWCEQQSLASPSPTMTTRREFLRTSTAAAVLAGAPSLLLRSRAGADIVIRNGTVFVGLGGPGRELDVAISNDRILAVGRRLSQRGDIEFD